MILEIRKLRDSLSKTVIFSVAPLGLVLYINPKKSTQIHWLIIIDSTDAQLIEKVIETCTYRPEFIAMDLFDLNKVTPTAAKPHT